MSRECTLFRTRTGVLASAILAAMACFASPAWAQAFKLTENVGDATTIGAGGKKFYFLTVPSSASEVDVELTSVTGNVSLYAGATDVGLADVTNLAVYPFRSENEGAKSERVLIDPSTGPAIQFVVPTSRVNGTDATKRDVAIAVLGETAGSSYIITARHQAGPIATFAVTNLAGNVSPTRRVTAEAGDFVTDRTGNHFYRVTLPTSATFLRVTIVNVSGVAANADLWIGKAVGSFTHFAYSVRQEAGSVANNLTFDATTMEGSSVSSLVTVPALGEVGITVHGVSDASYNLVVDALATFKIGDATVSQTTGATTSIIIPITLSYPVGQIASFQIDVTFDPTLTRKAEALGAAATAAGKSLDATGAGVNTRRYFVFGDVTPIGEGVVLSLTYDIPGFDASNLATQLQNSTLNVKGSGIVVSNRLGAPVPGQAQDGKIKIDNFFNEDLNQDNATDALDIQIALNAILGAPNPNLFAPNKGDVNGDGFKNILDLQRVINRVLGKPIF